MLGGWEQCVPEPIRVSRIEVEQLLDHLILISSPEIEQDVTLMRCSVGGSIQVADQAQNLSRTCLGASAQRHEALAVRTTLEPWITAPALLIIGRHPDGCVVISGSHWVGLYLNVFCGQAKRIGVIETSTYGSDLVTM